MRAICAATYGPSVETNVPTFRFRDPENTMVVAAEKGRTERTGEFDVAYTGQAEGAAQVSLLFLEPFSTQTAAGCLQQRCECEKVRAGLCGKEDTKHCAQFKSCLEKKELL